MSNRGAQSDRVRIVGRFNLEAPNALTADLADPPLGRNNTGKHQRTRS